MIRENVKVEVEPNTSFIQKVSFWYYIRNVKVSKNRLLSSFNVPYKENLDEIEKRVLKVLVLDENIENFFKTLDIEYGTTFSTMVRYWFNIFDSIDDCKIRNMIVYIVSFANIDNAKLEFLYNFGLTPRTITKYEELIIDTLNLLSNRYLLEIVIESGILDICKDIKNIVNEGLSVDKYVGKMKINFSMTPNAAKKRYAICMASINICPYLLKSMKENIQRANIVLERGWVVRTSIIGGILKRHCR